MPSTPILRPANYVPLYGLGYASDSGDVTVASASSPLPVAFTRSGAAPAALSGTTSLTTTAGPFAPRTDWPVTLTLSGVWQGTVSVLRSTDGGTTQLPLTLAGKPWARFTGNVCEQIWTEYADLVSLYLAITLTSGTVAYRLGH